MLSDSPISTSPMSSYLDLLLSGEAYFFVMYISDEMHQNVYITTEVRF